jgi:hypothetical protein
MRGHSVEENLERLGHAGMLAWARLKKSQTRLWGEWMIIGEALMAGREWAMRKAGIDKPEGKGYALAFNEWLTRYKMQDLDQSDRAKLLQIMEERPAVEEWRSALPSNIRFSLNNPTMFWRKWNAATKVKKPKSRTAGSSASEMTRAKNLISEKDERIDEVEDELTSANERIKQLEGIIDRLKSELIKHIGEAEVERIIQAASGLLEPA